MRIRRMEVCLKREIRIIILAEFRDHAGGQGLRRINRVNLFLIRLLNRTTIGRERSFRIRIIGRRGWRISRLVRAIFIRFHNIIKNIFRLS